MPTRRDSSRWARRALGPALLAATLLLGAHAGAAAADDAPLPDTTWLLQVGPRVTTARDLVESYFSSMVEFRPKQDSLGRVEFLRSMRDKDIFGLTALALDTPLGFEQRAIMREHTQRVLSNALYQRMVIDSVKVTEDEVNRLAAQYGFKQHLRQILFDDRPTAERVRRELLLGRITWRQAVSRFDRTKGRKDPDGDIGWLSRTDIVPDLAFQIYDLKPGETSEVVEDRQGFHLVQSIERENTVAPAYPTSARSLRWQISDYRRGVLSDRFLERLGREHGFQLDSANIIFASSKFKESIRFDQRSLAPSFEIEGSVPEFAPEDTGRVLARWEQGTMTISRLLVRYSGMSPIARPSINTPEAMARYVRSATLEPALADFARATGLESAPDVQKQILQRKEQLLVEQMYRDSVAAYVRLDRDRERAYYREHQKEFVTYPTVKFAAIARPNRAAADSLVAALEKGARAEDILREDSLRTGAATGSIQERRHDQVGPYHKVIFEELRPGQATIVGPDRDQHFAVIQSLAYDPGHQLSFEEAEGFIAESVQNMDADARLKGLISRLEKRYKIRWRPELLMRVRLVDPLQD